MSKLELTKTQIENIENKSMLVLQIDISADKINEAIECFGKENLVKSALRECTVQKGDKDVWIAEDFAVDGKEIYYRADSLDAYYDCAIFLNTASQMTKEQSRYTISEILDVRVVRVQDIGIEYFSFIFPKDDLYWNATDAKDKIDDFKEDYNQILKEHNIDRTYDDNDYVFLVEYRY